MPNLNPTLDEILSRRTRCIFCMTYGSVEEIEQVLQEHQKQIRAYAYICHDKDVDIKTGELKEPHRHIVLVLYSATTSKAVIKWFKKHISQNFFAEPCKSNTLCAYEYLTHKNDPDKFQYPDEDLTHGNLDYWQQLTEGDKDEENIGLQIVEDLIRGTSYYEMCVRYGREWVIYHERYEKMALKIKDGFRL